VPGLGQPSVGWTRELGSHGRPARPGWGLLENCMMGKVQVTGGPFRVGRPHPSLGLFPVLTVPLKLHWQALYLPPISLPHYPLAVPLF
jgi:hypothetical protein